MKSLYLILALVFLQCQTKYAIYQRNDGGLHEQFDINLKSGLFLYRADSMNLAYSAKGVFELVDSVLHIEFPENSESNLLSPFKKGFVELVKTSESDRIDLEVTNFDVRTNGKLSPSRHFPPSLEILSLVDSVLIKEVPYSLIQIQDDGKPIFLRSKVNGYFDQYILIPSKGEYKLNLYLQPVQTFVSYETTATNCYEVVSGPLLQVRASGIENKMFKRLFIQGEFYIPYSQVDKPFFLSGIEKRKLRLVN